MKPADNVGEALSAEQKKVTARVRVALDPASLTAWMPRVVALFARLDAAQVASVLPEEPPNELDVRDWLLAVRRSRF